MKTKAAKKAEQAEKEVSFVEVVPDKPEEIVSKERNKKPEVENAEVTEVTDVAENKEPTPSEINESLEAEAADSQPAPEVSVDYDYMQGLKARTAIPEALDKKNPNWVHVWQPSDIEPSLLKAKRMEVILKDGDPIRDGGDFLCKMPKELFNRRRATERYQSESSIAGLIRKGEEQKFKRKRNPKIPPGKED